MSRAEWEAKFTSWSKGPGKTEEEKCGNAERMVREAINASTALKQHTIEVFVQGSYRNRTNVRLDSDVDVCVRCTDLVIPDYSQAPGVNDATLGFTRSSYGFTELKRDVEAALVAKFGRAAVTRGDKAFDVKENTYRVAADVVPTFEGRLYYRDSRGQLTCHSGTVLQCSSTGRQIHNWPHQHYANGVRKHDQTNRQFKKKARCLKNLSNEMCAKGNKHAEAMASFLLESLVYNCPNSVFSQPTHYDGMREIIRYLFHATKSEESAAKMLEVNDIKFLFHWSQGWDRATAHAFLRDAWHYVGFTN